MLKGHKNEKQKPWKPTSNFGFFDLRKAHMGGHGFRKSLDWPQSIKFSRFSQVTENKKIGPPTAE